MKSEGKSNELQKRLKSFGLNKAVLIDASVDENFSRATRNLETFKYFPVEGLNVFDLLKYDAAIITKDSVAKIIDRCSLEKVR
jgi:large subunit ribosomal protein L4